MDYSGYTFLQVEPGTDRVLRITMNRPERLNAANERGHGELGRIWVDFANDDSVNVALITGAGRAFCAGGDVKEGAGPLDVDIRDARAIVRNMILCRKPMIAAVNGVAVGAGLAVALCADITVCSDKAVLIDGHTKLGIAAGDHAALIWPLTMGMARAKYYALTCERMSGQEAMDFGLVAKCVPHDELIEEAERIAQKLSAGPQFALQGTKSAFNNWYLQNMSIFEHSLYLEALGMTMPDYREAEAAFAERRDPQFGSQRANL
jgi:enoyl-CoA hydratase